ncbi:hypothetical protein LWI29_017801 [Acer saccharum]|uniref:Ribosome biogenesis protein NOP53 n=1 Tax=Acer saccharum TaxID=4024 RepID=A0AA39VNG1_ACESA|nr:hypothetical protein LWI29_017801 [Acer saccharum]
MSVGVSMHGSVQSSGLLVQGNKSYVDLFKTSHSLPRGKAIVGEVDPLMGSSLPLSSIRGSSYADLFMAAQIQEDNVSSPLILSKKGGYVAVQVGRNEDFLIGVPVHSSRVGAVPVSSKDPSSILDVSVGVVVSISSVVSMVGQGSKVGRDYVSPLVSFDQPIVSSVVSVDELDDRVVLDLLVKQQIDSVLQKNPFVQIVPSSKSKPKKSIKKQKDVLKENDATVDCPKDGSVIALGMLDIWANDEVIPAVEVEAPGCSFNPAYESRQESLAQAVAEEMQKVYQNELGPEPIPFTVPGHAIDDEDRYFLEVDNASDDEGNVENLSENAQEKRSIKTKRVTRVELNKRARLKDLQTKKAKAKKVEEVSKQIDCLPDIIQEIAKEDEENKKRHMRRLVAKQERLKVRPPRLGRHKFEPAPTQVLLSEEINGSLRKLKDESVIATGILDIWANDEGEGGNKAKKVSKPSVIPAVEVEAPGCSVSSMEVIT